MHTTSRFAQCSARSLSPMDKLQESVDLLLQKRIGKGEYVAALVEVGNFVELAQDMLAQVQFPAHYDAGAVLLNYATEGMDAMAAAVDNLTGLWHNPDPQFAQIHLEQAQEAFVSLQELLHEVQAESQG